MSLTHSGQKLVCDAMCCPDDVAPLVWPSRSCQRTPVHGAECLCDGGCCGQRNGACALEGVHGVASGSLCVLLQLLCAMHAALRNGCMGVLRHVHVSGDTTLATDGAAARVSSDACQVVRLCTRGTRPSLWVAIWLILPVVICLSQRLSHACLSINAFIVKLQGLIISVIVYLMVVYQGYLW